MRCFCFWAIELKSFASLRYSCHEMFLFLRNGAEELQPLYVIPIMRCFFLRNRAIELHPLLKFPQWDGIFSREIELKSKKNNNFFFFVGGGGFRSVAVHRQAIPLFCGTTHMWNNPAVPKTLNTPTTTGHHPRCNNSLGRRQEKMRQSLLPHKTKQ